MLQHRRHIIQMKRLAHTFGEFDPDMLADQTILFPAKKICGFFIQVAITPVFVQFDKAIRHRFKHHDVLAIRPIQRFFGIFLFRDVICNAKNLAYLAFGITGKRLLATSQAMPVALVVTDAIFNCACFIIRSISPGFMMSIDKGQIIGMKDIDQISTHGLCFLHGVSIGTQPVLVDVNVMLT